jgi:alkylation response protein AidB-like acyl-CoA dehydrogenase
MKAAEWNWRVMRYQQANSKPPTHRACTAVLASGRALNCYALTDEAAGSHAAALRTTAMLCNSAGADMTITARRTS